MTRHRTAEDIIAVADIATGAARPHDPENGEREAVLLLIAAAGAISATMDLSDDTVREKLDQAMQAAFLRGEVIGAALTGRRHLSITKERTA